MDTGIECVCCQELEKVVEKMSENDTEVSCITNHEGFEAVCLNWWVLQTVVNVTAVMIGQFTSKFCFDGTFVCYMFHNKFFIRRFRFTAYVNSLVGAGEGWEEKLAWCYQTVLSKEFEIHFLP